MLDVCAAVCALLLNRWTLCLVGAVVAFKLWHKFTVGACTSTRRLDGLTALVTGANTGIGLETALDLARRGARVLLACRDPQRGQEALKAVRKVGSSAELLSLDLESLESVRKCAAKVVASEPRLDILVNNAGSGLSGPLATGDGLSASLQVNHFGPFLFTLLLVDLLKKSAPSRIVFVSSILHEYVTLDPKILDLPNAQRIPGFPLYALGKLLNVIVSNELARRLLGTGVTVNSLHPGAVHTDIFRHLQFGLNKIIKWTFSFMCKTPVEGAQTSIYLAVSEEVEGVTGRYFSDCKEKRASKQASDEALARAVWLKSEQLVKLTDEERPSCLQ